jgi:hypothetical protein
LLEAKSKYRVLAIEARIQMTAATIRKPEAPTTVEPSSAFTDFILAHLNCIALRFKIITNEIEATAAALSAGLISPEAALLILAETGLALDEVSS